ncbi:hypothetical protein CapIbe_022040 [Capra ibex]
MLQKEHSGSDIYSESGTLSLSYGQLGSSVLVVTWAVLLKCNPTQWPFTVYLTLCLGLLHLAKNSDSVLLSHAEQTEICSPRGGVTWGLMPTSWCSAG